MLLRFVNTKKITTTTNKKWGEGEEVELLFVVEEMD
jgi:hypothetical protein